MSLNTSFYLCSINVSVLTCETDGIGRLMGSWAPGRAARRHLQLIQRRTPPSVSGRRAPPPDLVGERLAELERPLPHDIVTDDDAACDQHLLDHAQAEWKAEVEPYLMTDYLGWETVAGIAGQTGVVILSGYPPCSRSASWPAAKLTVPIMVCKLTFMGILPYGKMAL
jgi:hypothetical protein